MPRIVSLIASATEIVCALGFQQELVGRSHECDFPASVERLPVCTEPKFNLRGTSAEIDQRVKALLQEGLSVYRVDADRLRQLQPDIIITQTQCEVCAVSLRDVEAAVCQWLDSRPRIVSLAPNALADVWEDIRRVAEALCVPERGAQLIERLQQRMTAIADRARTLPQRPTVACIEWIEPLMSAGNWMPELVAMAGGVHLFATAGKHAPYLNWDDLCAQDPEVILVLPCGWEMGRSRQEMPALARKPEWAALRAVQSGRVYLADGNQYFNRPGPRLVESLEILAEVLHPEAFAFGHEGSGWQRLDEATPARPTASDWRTRLTIVRGDITRHAVDAIVNAANTSLLGGGGVDGAIHRAAGPRLLDECRSLHGCATGAAKITGGYNLPARHVIHTVGPIWRRGYSGEDEALARCYRSCFVLAEQHGLHTLAFPSISTGAYGFPVERAARIALAEIRSALSQNRALSQVIVVCFEETVYDCYLAALQEMASGDSP